VIRFSAHVFSAATAATTLAAFCAVPVFAQSAGLSVGARVAPQCRFNVESTAFEDGRSPGVRVQCGRSGLRVLRVTTDRGDGLQPTATIAGRQMLAGGEMFYLAAQPLATVASLRPTFAPPPPVDPRPITITLDF